MTYKKNWDCEQKHDTLLFFLNKIDNYKEIIFP